MIRKWVDSTLSRGTEREENYSFEFNKKTYLRPTYAIPLRLVPHVIVRVQGPATLHDLRL